MFHIESDQSLACSTYCVPVEVSSSVAAWWNRVASFAHEVVHGRARRPAEDGTLFTTRFNAPYRHDYYGAQIFVRAARAAGLPAGTTPHDLRHHYASVLLAQGESVVAVAKRLGHENAALVLSTYGHLMPDSEDRTRRVVNLAWSCALSVPQDEQEAQ